MKDCAGCDVVSHLEAGRDEGLATGDAPMAACCERELEDRKEANRVLTILREHDPSTRHERERRRVVTTEAPKEVGSSAASQADVIGDEFDDDDLDDFDEEFEKYRTQRLRELQEKATGRGSDQGVAKALKLQLGNGVVHGVDNTSLQEILKTHAQSQWSGKAQPGPPVVLVCQFSVKGDVFSHELSELLDELAATDFMGTKFVRIEKVKGVVVNQRDKVNQAAICCFENGRHKAILFGEEAGAPEEVNERAVVSWLLSCGCRRNTKRGLEDGEGDLEPCEVCGRCYPHEHIKAVYGMRSDSEEETEGEEDAWD